MNECAQCGCHFGESIDRCPACGWLVETGNVMRTGFARGRAAGVYRNLGAKPGGRGNFDPGNFRFSECPSCKGLMRHGRGPIAVGGVWQPTEIEHAWFCDACGFQGDE